MLFTSCSRTNRIGAALNTDGERDLRSITSRLRFLEGARLGVRPGSASLLGLFRTPLDLAVVVRLMGDLDLLRTGAGGGGTPKSACLRSVGGGTRFSLLGGNSVGL